ncbi:hypothetical protein [Bradyrhizobium guangdongense]
MEGFYAAYLTGRSGTSTLLFAIRGTTFVGVDVGGIKYDGVIQPDGQSLKVSIVYVIPAGTTLITSTTAPTAEQRIPLEFMLPTDFWNGQVIGIATPLGPVNAKFQKLREW